MQNRIKLSLITALLITGANANINLAPYADFTCSIDHMKVQCDASRSKDADGKIERYDWDFGDMYASDENATTGGVIATHTYAKAGTYTIKLTVYDDGGKTGIKQKSITIQNYMPVIEALRCYFDNKGYSKKLFCEADVTNPGKSDLQWRWYVDGNLTSSTPNSLTYNVKDYGEHIVKVAVANDYGITESEPYRLENKNPSTHQTKKIQTGWAIYSDFRNKNEKLGDLNEYVKSQVGKELIIWAYVNGQWYTPYSEYSQYKQYYNPDIVIKNIDGFWIYSPEEYYVEVSPSLMPTYQNVSGQGWHLIGNPVASDYPLSSLLNNSIITNGGAIGYRYINGAWKYYDARSDTFYTKDTLGKFEGMWVLLLSNNQTVGFGAPKNQEPLKFDLNVKPMPENLTYSFTMDVKDIDSKPVGYIWIFDNDSQNRLETETPFVTHKFVSGGEHTVYVYVRAFFDDNTTYEKSFSIDTKNLISSYVPQIDLSVSPSDKDYKKVLITLKAYDKDGLKNINVDFGDGTQKDYILENNQSVTIPHTYSKDGAYTLTVTATDRLDNAKKVSHIVVIMGDTIAPTINDINYTGNLLDYVFSADVTPYKGKKIVQYDWDFDGKKVSTTSNIVKHTFKDYGLKVVNLTVTDDKNATAQKSIVVNVAQDVNATALPVAKFSCEQDSNKYNEVVCTLHFASKKDYDNFSKLVISFGEKEQQQLGGQTIEQEKTYTYTKELLESNIGVDGNYTAILRHDYLKDGAYTIKADIYNALDEYYTLKNDININGMLYPPIINSVNVIDKSNYNRLIEVNATAQKGKKIVGYEFIINGKTYKSDTNSILYDFGQPGSYYVIAKAYDNSGAYTSKGVTVDIQETPSFSVPTIESFKCFSSNGYEFNCDVNMSDEYGIKQVDVDFGDGTKQTFYPISNNLTFTHSYDNSGIYTISVTVTNEKDMQKSATKEVKVDIYNNPPVINNFTQEKLTDNTYLFTVDATAQNGKEIKEYDWDFGDGEKLVTIYSKVAHTYETSGAFVPSVKVVDNYDKYSNAYGSKIDVQVGGYKFEIPDNINTDYQAKSFYITGILTDSIGNPINDVNVTYSIASDEFIQDALGNTNGTVTTDKNGVFSIDVQVASNYIDANTTTEARNTYLYLKYKTVQKAILITQKGYTPAQ